MDEIFNREDVPQENVSEFFVDDTEEGELNPDSTENMEFYEEDEVVDGEDCRAFPVDVSKQNIIHKK